jgi:predicted nucleotidyltransferase
MSESNQNYKELATPYVLGFKEVMKHSQEYEIEDRGVQVPPMPGMVLLKLVAWSDRPEDRANDPYDILRIIEYYNDLEFETNMLEHHDLIPEEDNFDERKFSSRILGRKAKEYLDGSESLKTRIIQVLEENTLDAKESRFAKSWAVEKGWDLEYCVSLLIELKTGLLEERS